jgi:hypothetical protein
VRRAKEGKKRLRRKKAVESRARAKDTWVLYSNTHVEEREREKRCGEQGCGERVWGACGERRQTRAVASREREREREKGWMKDNGRYAREKSVWVRCKGNEKDGENKSAINQHTGCPPTPSIIISPWRHNYWTP